MLVRPTATRWALLVSHIWTAADNTFSQIPQINGLFASGMVLLLNNWGAKGTGMSASATKDIRYVHKAIEMLKTLEPWCAFVHSVQYTSADGQASIGGILLVA